MVPVIALVGRPNVGKSTLFNRLTRSRDALVANVAGLTRDRQYGEGKIGAAPFIVVDTGGISSAEREGEIEAVMVEQSMAAIREADIVLLVVDARAGLTAADETINERLRKMGKEYSLVLNKTDGIDADAAASDFARLGVSTTHRIAAVHGRGVVSMITELLSYVSAEETDQPDESQQVTGIKIGLIGRPNVGKSTLLNRLVGEQRVAVFDQAGTTRDSIYVPLERDDKRYTLIDTAGIRRRGKVNETAEKFSVIKTLQSIRDAHVVVVVIDAREGVVEQDLHLLGHVLDAGRAVVIAVNKWDGMEDDARTKVKQEITRKLDFVNFARIHMISAKHGTNVGHLFGSVDEAHRSATGKLSTNRLTRVLEDAVRQHQPPMVGNHRIKLRYCHAGAMNPPTLIVHGNQTGKVPTSYRRYLENTFRKVLGLMGTPIRFEFRTGDNPYAGKQESRHGSRRSQKK